MTKSTHHRDALTVILPVHNARGVISAAITTWNQELAKLDRDYELVIVDDGSTDETASTVTVESERNPKVRLLRHETRQGFGASLRTAIEATTAPLVFYSSLDYPYTPHDLPKLLTRIEQQDELLQRPLDLISGCRHGRPVPALPKFVGTVYRLFCRVGLGLSLEPLPGWLGFREHLRSWFIWMAFGDPLVDPNSAFKMIRRSLLERFPIQSKGDFVHVEIVAKATFMTALLDELLLTPRPDPIPHAEWSDLGLILRHAEFNTPPTPAVTTPAADPAPVG